MESRDDARDMPRRTRKEVPHGRGSHSRENPDAVFELYSRARLRESCPSSTNHKFLGSADTESIRQGTPGLPFGWDGKSHRPRELSSLRHGSEALEEVQPQNNPTLRSPQRDKKGCV